jgi:phosphocarrier protein HPr
MMLAASPGTQITLRASGRQAEEVLTALEDLICSRFGEGE